ncbi:type IV toxin-antitoxin system AbiEi family antitoxin domain-containing protein [Piscinibacterium candidicorallinum]|uniref:AbiEi antitoxin N-terminal domain-containing protein n=2 Tax=Piscinibacterium candidicorallinum TaxID=1793872 RepID=A0ABV7GXQ6_9BURK
MGQKVSASIVQAASAQRFLRLNDLRARGMSPQMAVHLARQGVLTRVGPGVYSLPDAPLTEHQSLAEAAQMAPRAVVCLLSALQFHGIGTQQPHQVWLALPKGVQLPRSLAGRARPVWVSGEAFAAGVETHDDAGAGIRVYGVAKTLADCFKFRNKVGLDVALEALREAWAARRFSMDDLAHHARINRVERVMQPYLEALTA